MQSCAALGAYVFGLEPLLGSMLAVLGRSWGLCWRSWAALGAYVGGLGSGSGPKLAVLGPKWSVLEAIRAKSGPSPSRKAIWQADQGREVAQTRARRPFWGAHRFPFFSAPGPRCRFFSVDIYIIPYTQIRKQLKSKLHGLSLIMGFYFDLL